MNKVKNISRFQKYLNIQIKCKMKAAKWAICDGDDGDGYDTEEDDQTTTKAVIMVPKNVKILWFMIPSVEWAAIYQGAPRPADPHKY